MSIKNSERSRIVLIALTIIAAFVSYFWGLNSVQIVKIGDEVLYLQIARVTAESSQLLPLRYEEGIFSTKPPLLYWLGIIASDWARDLTLWKMRLPVVFFTFLSAFMIFGLSFFRFREKSTALWAACAFLGFVAIYQHGRPFLVNSLEVFFLFLPVFYFSLRPKLDFWTWVVLTLSWAGAAWTKSFALIVVGAFAFMLFLLCYEKQTKLKKLLLYLGSAAFASLLFFALWFLWDPEPKLLFEQFVIGENAVKFKGYREYFTGIFLGNYTIFRIWLGAFANAGLYAIPLFATLCMVWKKRKELSAYDKALWAYILGFLIFYSLPTQRQENYILPVMAVLAIFIAEYRKSVPSIFWKISAALVSLAFFVLTLAPLILNLWSELSPFAVLLWVLSVSAFVWALNKTDIRDSYPLLVFLCFIQLTNFSYPFNKEFSYFQNKEPVELYVPSRRLAQHERFRFLAKGTIPRAYSPTGDMAELCNSLDAGTYLVVEEDHIASCTRRLEKIEEIIDFKTRHSTQEILEIATGHSEHLIRKLVLLRILP